jgi:hypothetical protein
VGNDPIEGVPARMKSGSAVYLDQRPIVRLSARQSHANSRQFQRVHYEHFDGPFRRG